MIFMPGTKTAAIVVTYYPDNEAIANLQRIAEQADLLFVVDNGSPAERIDAIQQSLAHCLNGYLLSLGNNEGVAAALNRGVEAALRQGSEFLLLLDQDSECGPGFVARMREAALAAPPSFDRILYSPLHLSRKTGVPIGFVPASDGSLFVAITAGTFFHHSLYERTGPFDESLFIDHVDDEYCLRLRRMGGTIMQVCDAVLVHEVGDPSRYRFLGREFSSLNHPAKRRYFIVRNRLLVLSKHFADNPRYTVLLLRQTLMDTLKIALIPKDRSEKLKLSFKGLLDALCGRRGNRVGL
jgi:rhamnosyltransferase